MGMSRGGTGSDANRTSCSIVKGTREIAGTLSRYPGTRKTGWCVTSPKHVYCQKEWPNGEVGEWQSYKQ